MDYKHDVQIEKALSISDYDCDERRAELTWLAVQAKNRKSIVEIGSYKGCTARAMADNTVGHVHCIDTFKGNTSEKIMMGVLNSHPEGWLLDTFKANTSDLRNLTIHQMSSTEAAQKLKDVKFDMIFIDASHDYVDIKADILAWRPLLTPGGLFCGHDRQWDGYDGGVMKAIDEFVPGHQVGIGAIWYWQEQTAKLPVVKF